MCSRRGGFFTGGFVFDKAEFENHKWRKGRWYTSFWVLEKSSEEYYALHNTIATGIYMCFFNAFSSLQ